MGNYSDGSAIFAGAMGSVVSGLSDVGLATWMPLLERSYYVDFSNGLLAEEVISQLLIATSLIIQNYVIINGNKPVIDFTIFTR